MCKGVAKMIGRCQLMLNQLLSPIHLFTVFSAYFLLIHTGSFSDGSGSHGSWKVPYLVTLHRDWSLHPQNAQPAQMNSTILRHTTSTADSLRISHAMLKCNTIWLSLKWNMAWKLNTHSFLFGQSPHCWQGKGLQGGIIQKSFSWGAAFDLQLSQFL